DVRWLDVTVDDAVGMGKTKRFEDLQNNLDGALGCKSTQLFQQAVEAFALDKFHREKRCTFRLAEIENGDDVGMKAATGSLRLAPKTLQPRGEIAAANQFA